MDFGVGNYPKCNYALHDHLVPDCSAPISLLPITPDLDREQQGQGQGQGQGDLQLMPKELPELVWGAHHQVTNCININNTNTNGSPQTPRGGVFDPFAPGPDHLVHAPLCTKSYSSEHRSRAKIVARHLDFDSVNHISTTAAAAAAAPVAVGLIYKTTAAESLSDQAMFDENLMQVIVSNQAVQIWETRDCKTPTTAAGLNGIAATCLGAPHREAGEQ